MIPGPQSRAPKENDSAQRKCFLNPQMAELTQMGVAFRSATPNSFSSRHSQLLVIAPHREKAGVQSRRIAGGHCDHCVAAWASAADAGEGAGDVAAGGLSEQTAAADGGRADVHRTGKPRRAADVALGVSRSWLCDAAGAGPGGAGGKVFSAWADVEICAERESVCVPIDAGDDAERGRERVGESAAVDVCDEFPAGITSRWTIRGRSIPTMTRMSVLSRAGG